MQPQPTPPCWRLASAKSTEGNVLFPGPGGRVMHQDDWRRWSRVTFRGAALAAGLPRELRPYDLRHLFASLLIKSGSNVVEVAGQLGHSASTCLGTYAHELEGVRRDATDRRRGRDQEGARRVA